jgi:hypothetical protein
MTSCEPLTPVKTTFSELAEGMVFYTLEDPYKLWRKVSKSEAVLDSENFSVATKRKVGSSKQVFCNWDV